MNHSFVQDNRLITAQYSRNITIIGQKLVRLAIANINSLKDDDFFTYKASILSIAELLEVKESKNIYRDLKKASTELLETKILVEYKHKKGNSFRRYNLFSYFDYNDGEGTITIRFNPDMEEFLLKLKSNFTKIPLEQVIFMNHKYSIRIYELLKMKLKDAPVFADNHSRVELTLEEIRKATNTLDIYKQPGQLREKVIYPALDDIEKYANYHCELSDIKQGRFIIGFGFDVWTVNGWNHQKGSKRGKQARH